MKDINFIKCFQVSEYRLLFYNSQFDDFLSFSYKSISCFFCPKGNENADFRVLMNEIKKITGKWAIILCGLYTLYSSKF